MAIIRYTGIYNADGGITSVLTDADLDALDGSVSEFESALSPP